MKKFLYILLALASLSSCKIADGYTSDVKNKMYQFAQYEVMDGEVYVVMTYFSYLYCMDQYAHFPDEERIDLQWFSYHGKYKEMAKNTFRLLSLDMEVRSNGLDWRTPESIFYIDGYTFICTDELKWTVLRDGLDTGYEFTITDDAITYTEFYVHGEGFLLEKEYHSDFDIDCSVLWDFRNMSNIINKWSIYEGQLMVNFYHGEDTKPADWVQIIFHSDNKIDYFSSRD